MRRIKLRKLSLILIMMMLLLPGIPASANTENLGTIKISFPGTQLTEPAYIVPVKDGRDTLELIDTQSAEILALREIAELKDMQIDKLIAAIEDLNTNRLAERSEWQTQVKNLYSENTALDKKFSTEKRKRWGIGVCAGVDHTGQAVVGFGITYSLVKF